MDEHNVGPSAQANKIDLIRGLSEFWRALGKLFWAPLLLAVLAGGLQGVRAWRSYAPQYASEATFTIQLTGSTLGDASSSYSYYSKATAEQLAKTFPYILRSDLLQSTLRQEMGVDWINGSITAQAVNETNLFSLRVTSSSAQDAYDILCAVIKLYPRVADYVIGSTQMNVLTPPALATAPYNPFRPIPGIVRAAAAGVCLGLLLVALYAATRRTVRTPEEVRRRLNQSCVAALPRVAFKRRSAPFDRTVSLLNPKVGSAFLESVRSMRIKLLRRLEEDGMRVVMVSSTLPGEGKTTVAVNLALTLSQNGLGVILVDLDLRKPSVKRCLGVSTPSMGVPELLQKRGGPISLPSSPWRGPGFSSWRGTFRPPSPGG